jgi:hypothetical protein
MMYPHAQVDNELLRIHSDTPNVIVLIGLSIYWSIAVGDRITSIAGTHQQIGGNQSIYPKNGS